MPCSEAMITAVVISPDQTVKQALEVFNKRGIGSMPVVEDGNIVGLFNFPDVLKSLLPPNVTNDNGAGMDFRLDYTVGSSPEIARHLHGILDVKVRDLMDPVEKLEMVTPETPLWEAVRLLVKHGSPLAVIEKHHETRLSGIITSQSMVKTLIKIADTKSN